jgi:hypothetical protein
MDFSVSCLSCGIQTLFFLLDASKIAIPTNAIQMTKEISASAIPSPDRELACDLPELGITWVG